MASIQVRKETGTLIVDLYYKGTRCREQTALADTPANRKKLQKLIDRMNSEMEAGTFDYGKAFPGSKNAEKFAAHPVPYVTFSNEVAVGRLYDMGLQAALLDAPINTVERQDLHANNQSRRHNHQ